MTINFLRMGGAGDCVMTSAVIAQFPGCHFYTDHTELAEYFDCDVNVHNTRDWEKRDRSLKDHSLMGYRSDMKMDRHLINYFCEEAGVPVGKMKLRGLPRLVHRPYYTLQQKSGWSEYKDYNFSEVVKKLVERGTSVIEVDERYSWGETLSLIQWAEGHIGIDSVCNHIAAAYETPAVILWGSTSPVVSGYPSAINIRVGDCTPPCFIDTKYVNGWRYGDQCPIGGCINKITTDHVLEAVGELNDFWIEIEGERDAQSFD